MVADGGLKEKARAGRARSGELGWQGQGWRWNLEGCPGRRTLAKSAPEVPGKEDEWAQPRPRMGPLKGALCWVPEAAPEKGESRTSSTPASSLIFYLVTCVSESYLKSLFEWSGERKEREKKDKEKVDPHIPRDPSLMGEANVSWEHRQRSGLRDRETCLYSQAAQALDICTGGSGGVRRIRAKGGPESRKNIGRRGACEQSFHCDLQNVVSSVLFSHLTLVITLGAGRGGQDGKCDRKWIQRGGLADTPNRPCLPGAYSFHRATS